MVDIEKLKLIFCKKYGAQPRVFRAPGRVNLIGEHTDYNDGFVLPCALDFATYVAAAVRTDRRIHAASLNFEHEDEIDLDDRQQEVKTPWSKYVQGIGLILERSGFPLQGANLLIDSNVPVGAGLSSSAALEVAAVFALSTLSGHSIEGLQLAQIGQAVEHEFAGVRSGIMDQFVSVYGEADHALFLDCRSLTWESIHLGDANIVICNTNVKHELAESEYNKRHEECEAAAAFFGRASLRDVSLEEFKSKSESMPRILSKRALHVITENERVLASVEVLKKGNLTEFGTLLNKSHESLRDDFEVSSEELDLMFRLAHDSGHVLGARMTGGGFGGCTINLLAAGKHAAFAESISSAYQHETGITPAIYSARIANGVCEIE